MNKETILTQLDRISADSCYSVSGNNIDLTIEDFVGFDDNWDEVFRDFTDGDAVEEIIKWLKDNADYEDGSFYSYYHFGDIVVTVGYSSFDI